MQVERQRGGSNTTGGERRTGEEHIGIYLFVGDNVGKLTLIPHTTWHREVLGESGGPSGLARTDEPMSD